MKEPKKIILDTGMKPVLYKNRRNIYGEIPEGLIVIEDHQELMELLREIA